MAAGRFLGDIIARYLGIGGATADSTNPLSVRGQGALFDGNSGGHQIRVNKAAAGDTASFLFQTGFSGRAEFGLIGNDDFELKVSADGSAFSQALVVARATGITDFKVEPTYLGQQFWHTGDFDIANYAALTGAAFTGALTTTGTIRGANGTAAAPEFSFTSDTDTGMYRVGANSLGFSVAGAVKVTIAAAAYTFDPSITAIAATGADLTVNRLGVGGASPDATNRLSVNTPAVLLNNAGAGIDMKFNKNAAGDDAALTFQTGFSTQALMGLLANNDFTIKVGGSFTTAMVLDNATGQASFPAGIKQIHVGTSAPGSPSVGDIWVDTN